MKTGHRPGQELSQMEALVKAAMDAGAFGMSTGLIYLPGTYSETGEVISLARVVAKQDGIYASHIRNEFELIIEAIEEAITIGREADIPVHISHYKVADNTMWGDSIITLGLVEAARAGRSGCEYRSVPLHGRQHRPGQCISLPGQGPARREDFQARLDDPATRARVKADTIKKLNGARAAGDLSRITIASFSTHPEYSGKTMAEVTSMNGREPSIENGAEVAMEILYEGKGSAIYFHDDRGRRATNYAGAFYQYRF